jgi:hypothetical protein
VERFGGHYLVRDGSFEVVEGSYQPARLAMVEPPSMEQARRWYDSEEYCELKQLGLATTASMDSSCREHGNDAEHRTPSNVQTGSSALSPFHMI